MTVFRPVTERPVMTKTILITLKSAVQKMTVAD
jgi:hypothetical protein